MNLIAVSGKREKHPPMAAKRAANFKATRAWRNGRRNGLEVD
jgi:hypothetical protein